MGILQIIQAVIAAGTELTPEIQALIAALEDAFSGPLNFKGGPPTTAQKQAVVDALKAHVQAGTPASL